MTNDQKLIDVGNEAANAIDDVLREVCGEERGFILLICGTGPNQGAGPGHIFSNIEPACIKEVLEDASKTLGLNAASARH